MRRFWLPILLVISICIIAVVVAYQVTKTVQRVSLIPAITVHRTLPEGGSAAIPIGPYFVRAHKHHTWCGSAVTLTKRGSHGVWRQRFKHCEMAIGPVKVSHYPATKPTPRPTAIPFVYPAPTPVPYVYPTPVPQTSNHTASCQQGSATDCALMLVDLINVERSQHGIAPLSYSSLLTNGTATCIGAVGHANHMANDLHTIAHDQFPGDVCAGYDVGENVGVSAYGSIYADAMQIHNGMESEPYSTNCQGNHHCDWMYADHTHVGIAFAPGSFQGLSAHYESEEYSNAG